MIHEGYWFAKRRMEAPVLSRLPEPIEDQHVQLDIDIGSRD